MLSINIQGLRNNRAVLDLVKNKYDCILLQEHWITSYDKEDLRNFFPGWGMHIVCADEDEEATNYACRPAPNGGVATIWKSEFSQYISDTPANEGNSRILVTPINIPGSPLCLINCYLPSGTSKAAVEKFEDDMDRLHTILAQYSTHEQLIMGDLNEDHFNRNGRKEKCFRSLMEEHKMVDLGANCSDTWTYENPYLSQKSHIDHAVVKMRFKCISWSVVRLPHRESDSPWAINSSYHHPQEIEVEIPLLSKSSVRRQRNNKESRIQFDRGKTDVMLYQQTLDREIANFKPELIDTETAVSALQKIVMVAMMDSTPYKKTKSVKRSPCQKNAEWTPELQDAVREAKMAHFQWKEAGRPGKEDPLWLLKNSTKRKTRSIQRRQQAEERDTMIKEIEEAAENDQQLLHKLIRKRRKNSSQSTALIIEDNLVTDSEQILDAWADYYETLATPRDARQSEDGERQLIRMITSQNAEIQAVEYDKLERALNLLKKKKAPDLEGLYAEQLQMFTTQAKEKLLYIINKILADRAVPDSLKRAYKLPIPKKGKDSRIQDNYRGITIASIILKVLEIICLDMELEETANSTTSDLQFGFTRERSPSMASLLITEALAEAKYLKTPLFVASLDARKAFDVVVQDIMLKKLHDINISGSTWDFIDGVYTNCNEVIRWQGADSRPYDVKQGVRQGGILSPTLYKLYIDGLLQNLQRAGTGTYIGSMFLGSPTCADDVLLMSNCPLQLQGMLNLASEYSAGHKYEIHPQKSVVTELVEEKQLFTVQENRTWHIGNNTVTCASDFTHLGLNWMQGSNVPNIKQLIQSARRTMFMLMRVGVHGTDGLGPCSTFKIVKTYVIPKLLHGLEAVVLKQKDIESLEAFFRKILRQIQSLPESTAKEGIYLLLGATTLESLYHIKVLTMFGNICRLPRGHLLYRLCRRQLAMRADSKASWLTLVTSLGEKYNINIHKQLLYPWTKTLWKRFIRNTIKEHCHDGLRKSAIGKTSLEYLCVNENFPNIHPTWEYTKHYRIPASIVRVRMLVGRYKHEVFLAKLQPEKDKMCRLCGTAEEDTTHMISTCPDTKDLRAIVKMKVTTACEAELITCPENPEEFCRAILNAGPFNDKHEHLSDNYLTVMNNISSNFCVEVDKRRNSIGVT